MCVPRRRVPKAIFGLLLPAVLGVPFMLSAGEFHQRRVSSEVLHGYENEVVREKLSLQARSIIGPSCLTNLSTESATEGFADISGAVSAKALVAVTGNSRVQTYNRTSCKLTDGQSLEAFFASTGITASTITGSAGVIYDRRSARLFLFALGVDVLNNDRFCAVRGIDKCQCHSLEQIQDGPCGRRRHALFRR